MVYLVVGRIAKIYAGVTVVDFVISKFAVMSGYGEYAIAEVFQNSIGYGDVGYFCVPW